MRQSKSTSGERIVKDIKRVGETKNVLLHYQAFPPEIDLQIKCQPSGIDIEVKIPKTRYASSLRFRIDENEFFDVELTRLKDANKFGQYFHFRVSDEVIASRILREFKGAKKLKLGLFNFNRSLNLLSGTDQIKPSEEITDTEEILVHGLTEEFVMNCAKYSR